MKTSLKILIEVEEIIGGGFSFSGGLSHILCPLSFNGSGGGFINSGGGVLILCIAFYEF